MKRKASFTQPTITHQHGFATLMVVLVLLVGMTTITLSLSRSGMLEQLISGNDIRAQEAQQASEAGLEYAIAWIGGHALSGVTDSLNCATDPGCSTLLNSYASCASNPDCTTPPRMFIIDCATDPDCSASPDAFKVRCVDASDCSGRPDFFTLKCGTDSACLATLTSYMLNCGSAPGCPTKPYLFTVDCETAASCPSLPTQLVGNDGGAFTLSFQYSVHYIVQFSSATTLNYINTQYIKITATASQANNNSTASTSTYVKLEKPTATAPLKILRLPGTWKDF